MDPAQPREDENSTGATPAPPQNSRSSVPSFLFMTFLLFMLTNHSGDEFLARSRYQDAMQSLQYQLSNFTAWMNGTSSNFTLPEKDISIDPLLGSFVTFGSYLDPNQASYYSNITGFIRGDIKFYNITPQFLATSSANQTWRPFAETLMYGTNTTEVVQRSASWNWMDTNKVTLSVVEKNSMLSREEPDLLEQIAVIHGHIEFINAKSSEDLRLDLEAVHFVANGSIFGFAEPNGRHIDARLLPSLVPQPYRNQTARVIKPQLTARITRLKNLIDAGVIEQETQSNDDTPKSTCPFTFYAQIEPAMVPDVLMRELEEEVQKPTGSWTVKPPKLSVSGVLISKECGMLYEMQNTQGLSSQSFFRKVTTYAGLATGVYLTLLILLSRQMEHSRTPDGISRVSRWSFMTQSIVDSVSFAGHITFAILADGRPSLSLVAPAFLACVLFVYEAQFALLIHQIQAPEDSVPSVPPPLPAVATQAPIPALTLPDIPASPIPTVPPADTATATVVPTPARLPSLSLILSAFARHIRNDPQARLWLTMLVFLIFIVRVIVSPAMTLLFVACMYSFFWMPQIVRSARRGRSCGLTKEYLFGTTVCRLYFALYFLACPKNVLDVEPRSWSYFLAIFTFVQVFVLILQEHLGPAFFLPKRFVKVQTYDYHPPMPLPDPESPEQSLGDCAICMDAIVLDTFLRHRSKSFEGRGETDPKADRMIAGGGLLNAVQMGVGASGTRKIYSLAPCHHLFHTECLERWLAIKNICPQCRRPLPPL